MIDDVGHPLFAARFEVPHEVAGGAECLRVFRCDLIAGQHLAGHPVVTLVRVHALDDPVAPPPNVRLAVANVFAVGPAGPVGVAPHVHPVSAPTLAVTRRSQQAIDDFRIGIGGRIHEECLEFFGCRRQADQVETDPAQQGAFVGFGSRHEFVFAVPGGDERIDGVPCPRAAGHRYGRAFDRLERPPRVRREEAAILGERLHGGG